MKLMRCTCPAPGTITVQAPDYGCLIGHGQVVDFDELLPAVKGMAPQTLGEALRAHHDLFDHVEAPPGRVVRVRRQTED